MRVPLVRCIALFMLLFPVLFTLPILRQSFPLILLALSAADFSVALCVSTTMYTTFPTHHCVPVSASVPAPILVEV